MQAEERRSHFVAAPRRHDYFRLLHLLREQGLSPLAVNELSLAFPAADIAGCDGAHVWPAFMGMLGVAGALPFLYTERIAAASDNGVREFVDMLSSRSLEQFDEAWRKHHPSRERLLKMLLALGGVQDSALAQYAGLALRRTVCAGALARAAGEYLNTTVRVEQFVGRWEVLEPRHRVALGAANAGLGRHAALGMRQWRFDRHVRVHVGPLQAAAHADFLPGGKGAAALRRVLRGLAGAGGNVGAEVCILLAADGVTAAALDGRSQVGYNAFLPTSEQRQPRCELRYRL